MVKSRTGIHFGRIAAAIAAAAVAALVVIACTVQESPEESVGSTRQALWTNGGFESNNVGDQPTGWTITTNINPGITVQTPQTLAGLNLAAGGVNLSSVVGGAPNSQSDPDAPLVTYPKYGNRTLRLNYLNATTSGNGENQNVNTADQSMTIAAGDVDPSDGQVHVRFVVLPILQNPSHTNAQQPYYFVALTNVTKGTILYQDFNYSASPGVPWKTLASATIYYTDWQLVDVSPGSAKLAIGDTVDLRVVASGCALGGHWGRVYVDGVGSTVPGPYVAATGPQSQNAGSNITYTFSYRNGGTAVAAASTVTFGTPTATTFVSASAGCTGLAAAGTGTETCALGDIPIGGTGTFQITVQIVAGTAAGTIITNGNYEILATGVSPLLGPKVKTTVTSGVTYADLSLTKSDGVAAVGGGQPVTYTIVASNAGPSAVTGATVTDTMPAQLTAVTWTCAGTGGATCAASGSGSISDATAAIPVGGAATYTVHATVVSGSDAGTLNNVASVAVPAGAVDPDMTNNAAGDSDSLGTVRALTLTKNAAQGGTITSIPASVSCGTSCATATGSFLDGSTVILNETPAAGWTFQGWTGACASASTASSCTFTMTGDQAVGVTFFGPPTTVTATGGGGQTTGVSQPLGQPLTATVKDTLGDLLPGVTVTFSAPGSGASAALGSGGVVVSNASGVATDTATANATPGAFSVTATAAGVVTPATFGLDNLGAPATVTVSGGSVQSATVGTPFGQPLAVTVLDSASQPVPGVTVTFGAPGSGASATLGAGTATTGATGVASLSVGANMVAGVYSVTATVAGVAPTGFALTNVSGGGASISALSGTPQTAVVGTAFGAALQVRVLDSFNNPVQGTVVTFAAPGSGASATLGATTATTDVAGLASVTATANMGAGSYNVTASAAGVGAPTSFALTNSAGGGAAIAAVSGSPQTAVVGTAFATALQVRVVDEFNNPVQGAIVTFVVPGSAASATLAVSTATTDASGLASLVPTANMVAGNYNVTATVPGAATAASFALTNVASGGASIAFVSGTPQTAVVGTAFTLPLRVRVLDAFGNPVQGTVVTFAATGIGAAATFSAATATTDVGGFASVSATANMLPGTYNVTATAAAVAAPTSFALTNVAGAGAVISTASGTPQTTVVGTAFTAPLQVRVVDTFGNPVQGAVVTFAAPGSGASATLGALTATTDVTGLASVTATAKMLAGGYSVTATAAGVGTSASFALTNTAGGGTGISAASGTPQTAVVGTAFAAPLQVRLLDAFGNPVPGVLVTFVAPGGGPSALLGVSTATTDATGTASLPATANMLAGSYAVTASAPGVPDPISFQLTNVASGGASITAVAGTPQTTIVSSPFGAPLQVQVLDTFNNPVPNVTVTFAAPLGGASATLGASSATTDASGNASITASANTVAGTYNVMASVGGLPAALFQLTNLAGAQASITALAPTSQSATVDSLFGGLLQAQVLDAFNNPVPNVVVTFTVPGNGASATLGGSTATTDPSGTASVTATANTGAGTYNVTASVPGLPGTASFALTNVSSGGASISVVSGASQTAAVGVVFAAALQVQVLDTFGNPVAGAVVTFAAPGGGASATLGGATATTDATGDASLVPTANMVAGSYNVTASIAGGATPATFPLTNGAGGGTAITAASGALQTAVVETAFTAPLQVLVVDAFGNPAPGVVVTFVTAVSGASATLAVSTATTDASGNASIDATANTLIGTYDVTATIPGVLTPALFALTNVASSGATITAVSGTPQNARVGTAFATSLHARVVDAFNNPIQGAIVTFVAPVSGASATLAVSTATTDATGTASLAAGANTVAGTYNVTATVVGVAVPASFALTNGAGPAATISATSGSMQTAAVGSTFGAPLRALVIDAFGNPVAGATVTFARPADGASATFTSTVTTDATGSASVLPVANSLPGSYSVTAAIAGGAPPASFLLANVAGSGTSITTGSGSSQDTTVGTAFTTPLQVLVVDEFGNPVQGVTVTFAVPSTGPSATLVVPTAVTDANGIASLIATANMLPGDYTVTASVPGGALPALFLLTNDVGSGASISAVAGTPQTAVVGTLFAVPLQVLVLDTFGNPVLGATVTFTAPATGASASFAVSTALTDATGAASLVATANTVPGAYPVTASIAGAATPVTFALTNIAGPAASVTAASGTPQTAGVGTAFTAPLQVLVVDALGNPVSGVTVTFVAPGNGASATLGASTVVTDIDGLATVTATADGVVGSYILTASTPGAASPASFALTNAPGDGGAPDASAGDGGADAGAHDGGTRDGAASDAQADDGGSAGPDASGDDGGNPGPDAATDDGGPNEPEASTDDGGSSESDAKAPSGPVQPGNGQGTVTGGGLSCSAAPGPSAPASGAGLLLGLVGLVAFVRARRRRAR